MAVLLSNIRAELLPGLRALAYDFKEQKEIFAANIFNGHHQLTTNQPAFTLDEIQEAEEIIKACTAPNA